MTLAPVIVLQPKPYLDTENDKPADVISIAELREAAKRRHPSLGAA